MASFIPQELREKIKAANDIVDVIGGYLRLKRVGSNYAALCPFHREKTPSFMVNPRLQIFHCFGCHKGGDVITFIMEYENVGFIEALRRLAARAGIPFELESTGVDRGVKERRQQLLEIHQALAEYWHKTLLEEPAAEVARQYLQSRHIDLDTIKFFKLGYAPDKPDDTLGWARRKNIPLDLLEEAGVLVRSQFGDGWYDRFRGRIIFPICNEHGWVIAFSGRILSSDKDVAKYLNSPETIIFRKGRVFYGFDKARRAIMDAGFAIVCEGQIDLIRIHKAGFPNVVAPQGTAFTYEQARFLKRFTDTVVLCFDSDEAGQRAMVRAVDALMAAELAVKVVQIPPPDDPDSFILGHGSEAFRRLVEEARDFFDYYLDRLCASHGVNSERGRQMVVQQMGEVVVKTSNPVLIESVASKTAARLGLSPISVHAEFSRLAEKLEVQQGKVMELEQESDISVAFVPPPREEMWLLEVLFQCPEVAEIVFENLDFSWITHQGVQAVLLEIERRVQAAEPWGAGFLLDSFEDKGIQSLVTAAAAADHFIANPSEFTKDLLRKLRDRYIDERLAELRRIAAMDGVSEEERVRALARYQELLLEKTKPFPQNLRQETQR